MKLASPHWRASSMYRMAAYLLTCLNGETRWDVRSWSDKFASMYGLLPVLVDFEQKLTTRGEFPIIFHALDAALQDPRFKGHTWVWLDASATVEIQNYVHPTDNVVYCVGADIGGYGTPVQGLPGDKVVIAPPTPGFAEELWAAMVVPILCHDRWCYLNG